MLIIWSVTGQLIFVYPCSVEDIFDSYFLSDKFFFNAIRWSFWFLLICPFNQENLRWICRSQGISPPSIALFLVFPSNSAVPRYFWANSVGNFPGMSRLPYFWGVEMKHSLGFQYLCSSSSCCRFPLLSFPFCSHWLFSLICPSFHFLLPPLNPVLSGP